MTMYCDHEWVRPRDRVCPECLKAVDDKLEAVRVEVEAFWNRPQDSDRLSLALDALHRIRLILTEESDDVRA